MREIRAEDCVGERVGCSQCGGESGVQGAGERGGVAGLLVEKEDARLFGWRRG